MMVHRGFTRWGPRLLIAALAVVAAGSAAASADRFENGIRVTLHEPRDIGAFVTVAADGRVYLDHPASGRVELDGSKDAAWQPLDATVVMEALKAMHGFTTDVQVDVFVLPAPCIEVTGSFARQGAIFLAPALGPVAPETVAYTAVHEMGHVLTWAFIDGQPGRWESYLRLRGLDGARYGPEARHADRPREILAEDLRHLFGGGLATSSGSIENHDLVLPDRVDGLRDLLLAYVGGRVAAGRTVASAAVPNPCNPMTTITMDLPESVVAEVELRIFDVRGRNVRTLRDGHVGGGRAAIRWDGTDDAGGAVASGRYFYVISTAGLTARGNVTLVR